MRDAGAGAGGSVATVPGGIRRIVVIYLAGYFLTRQQNSSPRSAVRSLLLMERQLFHPEGLKQLVRRCERSRPRWTGQKQEGLGFSRHHPAQRVYKDSAPGENKPAVLCYSLSMGMEKSSPPAPG